MGSDTDSRVVLEANTNVSAACIRETVIGTTVIICSMQPVEWVESYTCN
jgi:hypothetical protein